MNIRAVTSASESAAHDRAAIASGLPSRALMRAAGFAAAGEIVRRYGRRLRAGVAVYAGPGNNGGDAWVVARALAVAGVSVRVLEVSKAKTPDAVAERAAALVVPGVILADDVGGERVVVDGLLGTGSSGAPRGALRAAIARMASRRADGAAVVALDVPSGVDATTGACDEAVVADLTLTFGTMKRGLLVARGHTGRLVLLDIGLPPMDDPVVLVDGAWVRLRVPPIAAESNKGTRKRLAIVAGGPSMVGAALLAARAAHLSGIGLVRLFVAPANVPVVQTADSESLAFPWPDSDAAVTRDIADFAHAVVIGPGLGTTAEARSVVARVLKGWKGPTVVDADALNLYAGRVGALAAVLGGRPAVITPHPGEFGRLTGQSIATVLDRRFDVGADVARALGATVLLKGVPTVISAASGSRAVSAAGTPVLAVGGSGDLLAGIAGTLLAQTADPFGSATCAAWIHGTAAEIANEGRPVRAVALSDVAQSLGDVWSRLSAGIPTAIAYPVLAELPPVGDPV